MGLGDVDGEVTGYQASPLFRLFTSPSPSPILPLRPLPTNIGTHRGFRFELKSL